MTHYLTQPDGTVQPVEPAVYEVDTDDEGRRTCRLFQVKVRKFGEHGASLLCWFTPIIWQPETYVYGPYIFAEVQGKKIIDSRLRFKTELAEVKLDQLLARALGKRYQETPFLRLGGAPTLKKTYTGG